MFPFSPFTGTLRIVLKPLLRDMPLVGGVSVAFIVRPRIYLYHLLLLLWW